MAIVPLRRRLDRLERLATELSVSIKVERRMCRDMDWPGLLQLVDEKLEQSEADEALINEILAFVGEAAATPVLEYGNGKNGEPLLDEESQPVFEQHFFVSWLMGLLTGSWSLPEDLPRRFLEGFASRYGTIMWRCEECLSGLGNGVLDKGGPYNACPICNSANLSHKYLGGPPWDPPWVYRASEDVWAAKRPQRMTTKKR